ncbi:MAG: hypothetical protein K8H74_17055 [Notoacmeibacter sp.]|nr:hypothetical protein [Notoacmeibacter sp.]
MDIRHVTELRNRLETLDGALIRAERIGDMQLFDSAFAGCEAVIDEIASLPISGNPMMLDLKARAALWCADDLEDLLNADTRDVRLAAQVVAGLLERPSVDMV